MYIYESKDRVTDWKTGLLVRVEIYQDCMNILCLDNKNFNGPFDLDTSIDQCVNCGCNGYNDNEEGI